MNDVSLNSTASVEAHASLALLGFATSLLPKSRDDLSFTKREGRGDGNPGELENWNVTHSEDDYWHAGIERGKRFADEVIQLALSDETEAFNAIHFALSSRKWDVGGWGEETGFSESIARLALAGIRALSSGATPFEPQVHADD